MHAKCRLLPRMLPVSGLAALIFVLNCCPNPALAAGALALRCEYLQNPLGIHEAAPRLSWRMTASRRAERQTAYQVLVATAPGLLAPNRADLWDSGRVESDQSAHVAYTGKTLQSRMRCYWSVRVWDRDAKAGPWSRPALWSMGLLSPADWSAQWIAAPSIGQAPAAGGRIVIRKAV